MKRHSISDVAKRAGVSTATVSRVINLPDQVAEKTRKRVQIAIEELDYAKSAAAFSLKARKTHNILVSVTNVGSIFWSEVFEGLQMRAEETGYNLVLVSHTPNRGADHILESLRSGRVDGAVVLHSEAISPEVETRIFQLYSGTPPVVGFSEKPGTLRCPHIFINNRAASRTLVRHLIDAGHSRIGHITGPEGLPVTNERLGGFMDEMKAAGLHVRPEDVMKGEFHRDAGRRVARQLARRGDAPTAIFCANDDVAMGLISELWMLGIKVPEDISVVGFDNNALADVYVPPLTTIAQPRHQIGEAAMDLLLDVIADPNSHGRRVIELKLRLAKRMSVARLD